MKYAEIVSMLDREHYNDPEVNPESWKGIDLARAARYHKTTEAEVLRAMCEVAGRQKLRAGEKRCTSCGMPITFRNRTPYDRSGQNHFIACPNRKAHRRKRK